VSQFKSCPRYQRAAGQRPDHRTGWSGFCTRLGSAWARTASTARGGATCSRSVRRTVATHRAEGDLAAFDLAGAAAHGPGSHGL